MTRYMSYKYTLKPFFKKKFTISSFSTAYVFLEYLSIGYYCIFSLYKVTDFTIRESSYPSKRTFYMYQLPVTWFTKHDLLPITNPLNFAWKVTRYIHYKEWIKLFELRDQLIIQCVNFIPKHLRILNSKHLWNGSKHNQTKKYISSLVIYFLQQDEWKKTKIIELFLLNETFLHQVWLLRLLRPPLILVVTGYLTCILSRIKYLFP